MWANRESPAPLQSLKASANFATTRGRSGTNGGLTRLATPAERACKQTTAPEAATFTDCEAANSVRLARRQLISTQLDERKGEQQKQSGIEKSVGANEHELRDGGLIEVTNGSRIYDENSGAKSVSSIKEQKGTEPSRSLRSLIDNHKSWSERRREIIVDFKTGARTNASDPGKNLSVELERELDCSDSLNCISTTRVEDSDIDIDSNRSNETPTNTLAAKLNKDKKQQQQQQSGEESSRSRDNRHQSDHRSRVRDIEHEESEGAASKAKEAADGERSATGDSESGSSSGATRVHRQEQEQGQAGREEEQRAKGTRPPTFGLTPHKSTRLPYFSYHGKTRNINLVTSADRSQGDRYTEGSEESAGAGSSAYSGSVSSLASTQPSKIPIIRTSKQRIGEVKPEKSGRRFLSYSNISNLFPSRLMNIGSDSNNSRWDIAGLNNRANSSKQFRFGSEERPSSRAGAQQQSLEAQINKGSQGRASRLTTSTALLNRRNSVNRNQQQQVSGGSTNRSLNSLNNPSSPVSPAGVGMRRQNSTGYGINGNNSAQPNAPTGNGQQPVGAKLNSNKYTRPASVAGGAMGRHQRSPSANSLHYPRSGGGGGSAGLSPYGGPPPVDPDCPVHGYWPLSKSQQQLAGNHQQDQWDQPELLYDPYPAQPFMRDPYENPARAQLYSPGGGGATNLGHRAQAGKRPMNSGGAYYNNSSRFSLYHSPSLADGQRSSLAPASEQVRRILGYQPHARPIHLHPQWAYSRPFIHLMGSNARSPSPLDIDDLDANGQPIIRPRFELYNQLQDSQAIRAVDFHPSGEVYAVGANSRTLRICAYPADYELRHFSPSEHVTQAPRVLFKFLQLHRGSIYCVAFNGQGNLLATGSNDQTVQIVRYNSTTHSPDGDEYRLTMHDGTVRDLCFIDDQTSGSSLLLSAGGGDNKIYVTDCDTITPFQSMAGHTQPVMALHHWGGANFVSASQDRTLRFWDLRTRACTSIVSAPPATAILGAGQSGAAIKQSSAWGVGPGAPVCSVKVDPSGRLMASGHSDSVCMLYDIRGARIIQAFKPHEDEIRTVSFSPKSYYLLTGGYDGRMVLSDLQGDLTQPLPQCCVAESDDKIVQSKWHPTDFTFVTTSADKTASLWALPAE